MLCSLMNALNFYLKTIHMQKKTKGRESEEEKEKERLLSMLRYAFECGTSGPKDRLRRRRRHFFCFYLMQTHMLSSLIHVNRSRLPHFKRLSTNYHQKHIAASPPSMQYRPKVSHSENLLSKIEKKNYLYLRQRRRQRGLLCSPTMSFSVQFDSTCIRYTL